MLQATESWEAVIPLVGAKVGKMLFGKVAGWLGKRTVPSGVLTRSVGAEINTAEQVLQSRGKTLQKATLKALKLTKEQGKKAIEGLKSELGLRSDFHGKIMGNGDLVHPGTKEVLGNLFDYL